MKKYYAVLTFLFMAAALFAQLPQLNLVQVGTGFSRPVDIQNCGDQRIFVVEKVGRIKIMSKSGVVSATPFLDITSRVLSTGNEQGLLGLAFSPNYKQDGYFYVNYTNGTGSGSTRISRFSVSPADSNVADPNSEVILLTFTQPYTNHNGGSLRFGPDGYLYDGQGDGGSQNDPNGNGQSINTYLAKILRLDVTNQSTYAIPPTNPFVGVANAKEEIWAYGLRNPWRISFDRITGDFWIGDVGQGTYEEIDFQAAGDTGGHNYGWRCREGLHAGPNTTVCPYNNYTDPVFEYSHSNFTSCSVTGGYVYRGTQYSALWGRYLLTDYCSGQFWSVKRTGPNTFDPDTLQDFLNNQYMSFGQDNLGEMYVCAENGRVYRITETSDCNPVAFISFNDSIEGCSSVKLSALKGDTLSYLWYNTAGSIGGATSNEFTATTSDWYKVRVSKVQAGCEAFSDSIYVTVHQPDALTDNNLPKEFCQNSGSIPLAGYVSPAGGTYTGPGVAANQLSTLTAGAGTAGLQYTYINQFGCSSSYGFGVTIHDTAALTKNISDTVFCANEPALSLVGAVTPAGGVFSGNGVSADTLFIPASAGLGNVALGYTLTDINGCTSSTQLNMSVGAPTALTVDSTNILYCAFDDPDLPLAGFITPVGGVFSGTGVTNNNFNTQVPGTFTAYYTYTNQYGCQSVDSVVILAAICEGIYETAAGLQLQVQPNPSNGLFTLSVQSLVKETVQVSLTDLTGRICFNKNIQAGTAASTLAVDVTMQPKGVYSLTVTNTRGTVSRKIVIQ